MANSSREVTRVEVKAALRQSVRGAGCKRIAARVDLALVQGGLPSRLATLALASASG
jgi:hypothetical protein